MTSIDELITAAKKKILEYKEHKIDIWISANEHISGVEEFLDVGKLVLQKNLRVGDLWIRINGKLAFVFERKTIQDALASTGERSHHQKFGIRCLPIPSHRVVYVYEGALLSPSGGRSYGSARGAGQFQILASSQANSVVRDGLTMINTSSKKETVYYWLLIAAKVIEHADITLAALSNYPEVTEDFNPLKEQARTVNADGSLSPSDAEIDKDYAVAHKVVIVKRNLENPKSSFCAMLQVVRGMSVEKASAIASKYECMQDLCDRGTPSELADIMTKSKTGRSQRVGPALANRILNYLRNVVDE